MYRRFLCSLLSAAFLLAAVNAAPALAGAPVWSLTTMLAPAHLPPGGKGQLIVKATNLGGAAAQASSADPVKIAVELPAGVTVTEIAEDSTQRLLGFPRYSTELSCAIASLTCEAQSGAVPIYQSLIVTLDVSVAAGAASNLTVGLSASGGGASPTSVREPLAVGLEPVRFGAEKLELTPLDEDGSLDTQAGSHPFQLTTTLSLNEVLAGGESFGAEGPVPPALPKELRFNLPPGLVGNPTVVPRCTIQKFENTNALGNACPPETAIGVAAVTLSIHGTSLGMNFGQPFVWAVPLYNLTPAVGEPARFGFVVPGSVSSPVPVILDTAVRTGGDYGVVVSVHNISQLVPFLSSQVSFWGVPADPRHDDVRGTCVMTPGEALFGCGEAEGGQTQLLPTPFLTLPTTCTGLSDPLTTSVETASWAQPSVFTPAAEGEYRLQDATGTPVGLDGCNRLRFNPSIGVAPDGHASSTPTGLTVDVHVPQEGSSNASGLAESAVKDITVALPEGVSLNAAGADGLQACSQAQVGFTGVNPETGYDEFSAAEQTCPDSSKVGNAVIHSPLLPDPLKGAVYLATPQNFAAPPQENPFGSLIALYLVARDPVSGVLIKLPGVVALGDAGQITATFEDDPQLPFEDAELEFFGGDRAPLSSPPHCGAHTTDAVFAPWSGAEPVDSQSRFETLTGPDGSPCPGASLPFAPSLTAGTTSIQAGGFTPFAMTMSRQDGEQNLQQIQLHMPAGLLGTLSQVALCGEAQADAGTCGPQSLIGETTVSVGVGGDPFSVTGGKVYITGPYKGAPFGLSIVNPAQAGPFDLGQVVVRAKIEVDPSTSALTITTDSSGPYKIPTILDGIPLQIKHVNVVINRPGFIFNPTDCNPLALTGSIESAEGASAALAVPFQITNCAALAFKPKLAASTSGKTSRANGASLVVQLSYPAGPHDANIAEVKVELPKALPSRLTTLQKACTAATFDANPADCPAASIIGHATASTPVLPVSLSGPAYFVSHGGEAFPSLIIVLQGYGVTVDLVGSTFISRKGITSSTFKTVPDVPVGGFELTLPEGPHSALAANGNLCKRTLAMPTEFVGQNGAEIRTSTKIAITGCPKARRSTKHKRRPAKRRHGRSAKPSQRARARGSR